MGGQPRSQKEHLAALAQSGGGGSGSSGSGDPQPLTPSLTLVRFTSGSSVEYVDPRRVLRLRRRSATRTLIYMEDRLFVEVDSGVDDAAQMLVTQS